MRLGKRSLRVLVVAAVLAVAPVAVATPALAWYPNGFSRSGDAPCGSTRLLGTAVRITALPGEQQLGHTGPWGPARVVYNSPSNQTTESVQRRAVAVRSLNVRCVSGRRHVDYRYSQYERRTQTTAYRKAGGSMQVIPLPNNPRISSWVAE